MKNKHLLFLFLILIGFNPFEAFSQSRDREKERIIELQLQAIDPTLIEPFKNGTVAMDQQNYLLADSLYSIVYEKAPNFEPVIRRLGAINIGLGKSKEGIALCEKAVNINRSSENLFMLASSIMNSGGTNGDVAVYDLMHARDLLNEGILLAGPQDFDYGAEIARVNLQLHENAKFQSAVKQLLQFHPEQMGSHYYAAIAAAQVEDWVTAEKEIKEAQKMGLPDKVATEFLDSGISGKASTARYKHYFYWVLLVWACGLVLLFLVGILLSFLTLKSIEQQIENNSIGETTNFLRKSYAILINVASVYYYISLPIILILVAALVVGVFYLFLMIGRIPIQLMLVIVIGGCITIYSMIRSLILKVNYNDPGRELLESDAPELFALTRKVANTMGTRPIDEIRITPEVDLAVYEKGSWREKMRDNGKRILILGTGVLKDFKKNDFEAVLAHEYGHFSHRDTAGGDVALRVRRDMNKYLFALYLNGQTVWWNVAFQFLRMYNFIFRRITNGATRLQEILADRVAAQTYGASSFQNGLTYVIKRNIEFVKLAKLEIEDAQRTNRPFNNLYELAFTTDTVIQDEFEKSLTKKTSQDDTHPSPVDRFRYIKGLGIGKEKDNSTLVRDLFVNWTALTEEMTLSIEESWKKNH